MTASSSTDDTVDFGSPDPVGTSATEVRFLHSATVFRLMPEWLASVLRLS